MNTSLVTFILLAAAMLVVSLLVGGAILAVAFFSLRKILVTFYGERFNFRLRKQPKGFDVIQDGGDRPS